MPEVLLLPEERALRLREGARLGLEERLRDLVGLRVRDTEVVGLRVRDTEVVNELETLPHADGEALRLGCERLAQAVGLRLSDREVVLQAEAELLADCECGAETETPPRREK